TETGGFRMAWIGFVDEASSTVSSAASAGVVDGYLDGMIVSVADVPEGRGPTGTAIRTGRPVIFNDLKVASAYAPWFDAAMSHGYRAAASFPLRRDGDVVGALNVYAGEAGLFGDEEALLLQRLADYVSFSLDFKVQQERRAEAEARLRQWAEIFQSTRVGVVVTRVGTDVVDLCNPAYAEMHGYGVDELPGVPVRDLSAPSTAADLNRRREELVRSGHLSYEAEHVRRDGSVFPVNIDVTAVPGSVGTPAYAIATVTDITVRRGEQVELERHREHLQDLVAERTAELSELNDRLTKATLAKSQFLANMSHELRTPLNSIIGFSGILLQGLTGELVGEQRRQVEMVNRSGRYLLSLINDVLDLSRIEAGRVTVETDDFDARDAVGRAIHTIRPLAEAKDLALEAVLPDTAVIMHSDAARVQQILLNLLGNAVKFTQAGEVRVRLSVRDGCSAEFEVSDTGLGIVPDELDQVFEEFHQSPAADGVAKSEGTGLGLPISRRLAELLGGRLTAASEIGAGSVFRLELPLRIVGAPQQADQGEQPLVLLVDDDESTRQLYARWMEGDGMRVSAASDGAEFLRLARECTPDLVVVDINLPRIDGRTVLQRLRDDARTSSIPVLCVSGEKPETYAGHTLADSCLVKPVSGATLVSEARRVLRARSGHTSRGTSK
ncbi:MAG: ATP-binding protein, partial [Coriobacteriia bacterium]|nr:ATP-binding protein [Coriobacteriia bacterium]